MAAWVLGALACGNASDTGAAPAPASTLPAEPVRVQTDAGGSSSTPDAATAPGQGNGSCDGGSCLECPPERGPSCQGAAVWARSLGSGTCCPYADGCAAPADTPRFSSEAECQTSCRCAEVTPSDFSQVETTNTVTLATERISLDCFCSFNECPASLSAYVTQLSDVCGLPDANSFSQLVGCGRVAIVWDGGFTTAEWLFDGASGALMGARTGSDTSRAPCVTYDTIGGQAFDCPAAIQCPLCTSDGAPAQGCE